MAKITLKGNEIHTSGDLPRKGEKAPDFQLTKSDLSELSLKELSGVKLLSIFPSIDTPVCQTALRHFYQELTKQKEVTVVNISCDLPFALSRFCAVEGMSDALTLSAFRSDFPKQYGVEIVDGPVKGLCARAVLILDEENRVLYSELVPEIAQEPDYAAALKVLSR